VHRILRAVRGRVNIGGRALDGVARGERHAHPDQYGRRYLRFHVHPPLRTRNNKQLLTLLSAVCQMNGSPPGSRKCLAGPFPDEAIPNCCKDDAAGGL